MKLRQLILVSLLYIKPIYHLSLSFIKPIYICCISYPEYKICRDWPYSMSRWHSVVRVAGFKPVGVERRSGSIPPSGRKFLPHPSLRTNQSDISYFIKLIPITNPMAVLSFETICVPIWLCALILCSPVQFLISDYCC